MVGVKRLGALSALVAVTALGTAAHASINFNIVGIASPDDTAAVTFTYTSMSSTTAELTIAIENTTTTAGHISGFAFNVPTVAGVGFSTIGGLTAGGGVGAIGPATSSATPEGSASNQSGWYSLWENNGIKTPNAAGNFDFGVMNNNNANSFITDGVGSGPRITNTSDANDLTTFSFSLTGSGLQSMTDAQFENAFLSELSTDSGYYYFAVRFQGLPDPPGSDLGVPTTTTTPVPVPGAAALAALGLGIVGWVNRRRPA